MPFKAVVNPKCPLCGKSVYKAEERIGAGNSWHKMCFKCGMCNKMLDSTTVAAHEGLVFCKICHGKKFGPKGYGFGAGAGALSMETGAQHGNVSAEMSNKPKEAHIGPSSSGPGPHCPRCRKTVYDNEKAIGIAPPFHKSCSKCKSCNKAIDYNTMAEHDAEIYCKNCYGKHFGPHGFGVGTLAK